MRLASTVGVICRDRAEAGAVTAPDQATHRGWRVSGNFAGAGRKPVDAEGCQPSLTAWVLAASGYERDSRGSHASPACEVRGGLPCVAGDAGSHLCGLRGVLCQHGGSRITLDDNRRQRDTRSFLVDAVIALRRSAHLADAVQYVDTSGRLCGCIPGRHFSTEGFVAPLERAAGGHGRGRRLRSARRERQPHNTSAGGAAAMACCCQWRRHWQQLLRAPPTGPTVACGCQLLSASWGDRGIAALYPIGAVGGEPCSHVYADPWRCGCVPLLRFRALVSLGLGGEARERSFRPSASEGGHLRRPARSPVRCKTGAYLRSASFSGGSLPASAAPSGAAAEAAERGRGRSEPYRLDAIVPQHDPGEPRQHQW